MQFDLATTLGLTGVMLSTLMVLAIILHLI